MTVVKDDKKDTNTAEVETDGLFKVAVYGSLREGLHNHPVIEDAELIGTFESQPEYTMYSVGGHYPGLVEGGFTSIIMEVYEMSEETFEAVNALEGFRKEGDPMNHYERKLMNTPYGEAYSYIYNIPTIGLEVVEGGDWTKFKKMSDMVNIGASC